MTKKGSVIILFGEKLPKNLSKYDEVLSGGNLNALIDPGSIYKAEAFLREISETGLPKLFKYKGYELWWMHYSPLFLYYCLPYTQYRRLLEYLRNFDEVHFYNPPYKNLFSCYLESYGVKTKIINQRQSLFRLGIIIQIFLTVISLPILAIKRSGTMIFIGDKFETGKDYDFRMKYIYEELRKRRMPFVEFIRSLESWRAVLSHALVVRRRPVIYSEAIASIGNLLGGRMIIENKGATPEERFKLSIAAEPLKSIRGDVWAIRITRLIYKLIGIRVAYITAANERNRHAFIACKIEKIPAVGILHGVASRYYNVYDFLPGFGGELGLSVDKYGLWSDWWREYYIKNSKAYSPEQLYVSGLMRPLDKNIKVETPKIKPGDPVRVLFISEQLAVPDEVMPYLEVLIGLPDVKLSFIFRHYRDGFRDYLAEHRPDIMGRKDINFIQGNLVEAIRNNDAVVGTMSTAVIEALLQQRVPVLFKTNKWGDYFNLKDYDANKTFFAETPEELLEKLRGVWLIQSSDIERLRERYFGDPYRNGSKWVVDQLEEVLTKK